MSIASPRPPAARPRVSLVRLESYDPKSVDRALEQLLEPLGGIGAMIAPGEAAVLKPNLLAPRAVDKAVCTHPEIIRGVARLVRAAGRDPVEVTDSPGVGSARGIARRLGLVDDELLRVVNPGEVVEPEAPGAGFHRLRLCQRMVGPRPLINIAKVKTHGQMVITAAVKNTFGCVVGLEKAQWHMRSGRDPRAFARMLLHVHALVAPRLSILDGVVGMEGNGPGSGDPRPLGLLAASVDAHVLDAVLCRVLGLGTRQVFTLAAAEEAGLLPPPDRIEVVGEDPLSFRPSPGWRPARPSELYRIAGPTWMAPLFERLLGLRPETDHDLCTACGECARSCAAGAIIVDKRAARPAGKMVIDRDACISCFCCQEMCPEGAIEVRPGAMARLLRLGSRGR